MMIIPIVIGDLGPVSEPAGQQARLNNLGYFAGFNPESKHQLKWAIEEFQCDHLDEIRKKDKSKKVDGICDKATQDVLEKAYGV
jgi:hypothetical protein